MELPKVSKGDIVRFVDYVDIELYLSKDDPNKDYPWQSIKMYSFKSGDICMVSEVNKNQVRLWVNNKVSRWLPIKHKGEVIFEKVDEIEAKKIRQKILAELI